MFNPFFKVVNGGYEDVVLGFAVRVEFVLAAVDLVEHGVELVARRTFGNVLYEYLFELVEFVVNGVMLLREGGQFEAFLQLAV